VSALAKDDVKYSKQELREDEFVSFATIVMNWIVKYRVQVIAAIAGIVVLVAVVEVGRWWVDRRNTAASVLLFEAMTAAGTEKSGQESDMTPARKGEAVKAFEKVISEYPSSEAARLAMIQAASLKLDLGDNDGAMAMADKYASGASSSDRFRQVALQIKGYALMNKGDAKGAAEVFRSLADAKGVVAKDYLYYDMGTALEKAGDKKGAADAYRRVTAEVPRSMLKDKAEAKAAELDPQAGGKAQ
jgi:hypothetical protein